MYTYFTYTNLQYGAKEFANPKTTYKFNFICSKFENPNEIHLKYDKKLRIQKKFE